jgi:hypothetical protein
MNTSSKMVGGWAVVPTQVVPLPLVGGVPVVFRLARWHGSPYTINAEGKRTVIRVPCTLWRRRTCLVPNRVPPPGEAGRLFVPPAGAPYTTTQVLPLADPNPIHLLATGEPSTPQMSEPGILSASDPTQWIWIVPNVAAIPAQILGSVAGAEFIAWVSP